MASRIIGLVLGLLIAAIGYLLVRPLIGVGPLAPPIDLGAFEGHRAIIGWGAVALGALAVLVNLAPGGDRAPKRKRALPAGADAPITFADDPPPAAPSAPVVLPPVSLAPPPLAPQPVPVAAPAPKPAPAAVTPAAAKPLAESPRQETFSDLRTRLHDKVRQEAWGEAGEMARRLPKLALTHRDRLQAAQDLGDFARGQGRIEEASEAYGEALGYARLIHEMEPADPQAADDLAAALVNVGDMASDERRLDPALGAYEEAVALRRNLVAVRGGRRMDRRALSLALERLADAREDRGHRVRALDLYRESLELTGALAAEDPQRYGADLAGTRTRFGELQSRLAEV